MKLSDRQAQTSGCSRRYSREDVTGVADELAGGKAGVQVPETEGLVPRRRKGELAVRRDDDVRDEVVVAVENLLGETERRLVAGELPDNDGLVCERCQRVALRCKNCASRFQATVSSYVPREAVRIMSGFSLEVAMAVTQPAWPARDPLKTRGSPILSVFWWWWCGLRCKRYSRSSFDFEIPHTTEANHPRKAEANRGSLVDGILALIAGPPRSQA